MTPAERDELLDAVETLERELEAENPVGSVGLRHDPLLAALADLVARVIRVWIVDRPPPGRPPPP